MSRICNIVKVFLVARPLMCGRPFRDGVEVTALMTIIVLEFDVFVGALQCNVAVTLELLANIVQAM